MAKRYPGRARRPLPHRHPDRALRAAAGVLRRGRGEQPVRRHPERPRARRAPARSASRRRPTSIPTREHPSLFEPVHGSAPDIAGPRHRQSDRPDLVGRADARLPRPPRRARRHRRGDRDGARARAAARPRTPDLGGTARHARPRRGDRRRARCRARLHRVSGAVKRELHERSRKNSRVPFST